jgi:DNA replication protein DnaC
VPSGHPDFGKLQACACGRAGQAQREQRVAALRDELAGLSHCTFATFQQDRPLVELDLGEMGRVSVAAQKQQLARAYRTAWTYAQDPIGWMFLHGSPGAGKSHLAAAIALHAAGFGRRVVYRSVPGLLDDLRPGGADPDAAMAAVLDADLVILDDIGAEKLSPWAADRLFRVTNERLKRPTVITSNHDIDQLDELLGPRIADRLAQAVNVWMPISSYRRIRHNPNHQ